MKRLRIIALALAGSLFLPLALALFWPAFRAQPHSAKVHPLVRELQDPIALSVGYYLDGGSIGLTLADATGKRLQVALPVDQNGEYSRLFLGTNYVKRLSFDQKTVEIATNLPGVLEVPGPYHTCLRLQQILENYEGPAEREARLALVEWRGDPADHLAVVPDYLRVLTEIISE